MARPLSKNAQHRRRYLIICEDPHFHFRKYFDCVGYKALLLKKYVSLYPDYNVSIFVYSGTIFSNIK